MPLPLPAATHGWATCKRDNQQRTDPDLSCMAYLPYACMRRIHATQKKTATQHQKQHPNLTLAADVQSKTTDGLTKDAPLRWTKLHMCRTPPQVCLQVKTTTRHKMQQVTLKNDVLTDGCSDPRCLQVYQAHTRQSVRSAKLDARHLWKKEPATCYTQQT